MTHPPPAPTVPPGALSLRAEAPDLPSPLRDALEAAASRQERPEVHLWDVRDPLGAAPLIAHLEALATYGARAWIHTPLNGLSDDQQVRPFLPFDVRFCVDVPAFDADVLAAAGRDLEDLEAGIRNLRAFGFVVVLAACPSAATVAALGDTVLHGMHKHGGMRQRLAWSTPLPSLAAMHAALAALDATGPRPRPRLDTEVHALCWPVGALVDVDLRAPGAAEDPWEQAIATAPDAWHGETPSPEDLASRRMWLLQRPKERIGRRGDPRDAHQDAMSAVLIRPGHPAFALVLPPHETAPAVVRTKTWGLYITGRMREHAAQARLGAICRLVREAADALRKADGDEALDVRWFRRAAQAIRRDLRPRHADEAVAWRDEGSH